VATERAAWLERRFGADVTWLAFDLHPEYPPEGIPRQQLLDRYGADRIDSVSALFEAAGLVYRPNPDVVPNSRLALELAEAAREQGVHAAFHRATMNAYWEQSRDIGDPAELRAIAADVGLEPERVEAALVERAYARAVDSSTAMAHQAGINAVPAFVADRRVLVLGAQPHEALEAAIQQAAELAAAEERDPAG
jgi:predicted DsbA family dithiol-disulfide isomerase